MHSFCLVIVLRYMSYTTRIYLIHMYILHSVEDQKERLHADVETVKEFSYLGCRMNSGGGCEAAVTSGTRVGWAKFRECQDLLCKKKFPLKIVYKSCMISTMLYGRKTCCLAQNEIGI